MGNLYKQAYDKIEVPQELIEKTANQIKCMQGMEKKRIHSQRWFKYGAAAGVAAACLVVVFALLYFIRAGMNTDIFVTKLTAGQYVEYVELKNGYVSFVQEGSPYIATPPSLGGNGVKVEEWDIERYTEYLGRDIKVGYLPEGLVIEMESAMAYRSQDGKVIADGCTMRYASPQGQSLTINIAKDRLPAISQIGAGENSVINGQPLTVGAGGDGEGEEAEGAEGVFWAQFVCDGVGYYIKSVHVSQEDFIRIVYGLM